MDKETIFNYNNIQNNTKYCQGTVSQSHTTTILRGEKHDPHGIDGGLCMGAVDYFSWLWETIEHS